MERANHPLELLVRNLQLRSHLPKKDREAVLALPFTLRTLEASTYIVREADSPEFCTVLVSGFAFRQKLTGDGARQIIAIHIPGDALDFQNLFLDVSDHSIQMLTRGEVAFVPRAAMQDLARGRAAVGHAILVKILVEASIFREWVLNVGRRNSRSRLAHVLCELGVRLEAQGLADEYGYELPMTQEQLADALGLTPVHVNRTLKTLEAEGLIQRTKRNISFPDWNRLRTIADFNQRYLHLEPQQSGR
ncbi:Crp/Fnr family transcriptional regulator [Sphingomonas sp.]|uniref:Crp/Fnr family transcriptional regulator n=1 Tax=Sphingomonas sp. TaxID=28214 RepID=UPI002FCBB7FE